MLIATSDLRSPRSIKKKSIQEMENLFNDSNMK